MRSWDECSGWGERPPGRSRYGKENHVDKQGGVLPNWAGRKGVGRMGGVGGACPRQKGGSRR